MCTRRWLKKGNEDLDPSTLSRQSSVFVATNASCSHFLLCSRWRQFHRLSLFHSSHSLMEVHWGASTSIQNTAEWEQHEVSWVTHGPSGEPGPTQVAEHYKGCRTKGWQCEATGLPATCWAGRRKSTFPCCPHGCLLVTKLLFGALLRSTVLPHHFISSLWPRIWPNVNYNLSRTSPWGWSSF